MNTAPIACTARAEIEVAAEVENPANTLPATNIVRPVRKAPRYQQSCPLIAAAQLIAPHRGY